MRSVSTENATIDYEVQGAGPSLVLTNGMGFGRWAFFKQVPVLSRRLATITFEAREGRDPEGVIEGLASDVVGLLDHLRGKRATCWAPPWAASWPRSWRSRPDLVARLVLVSTGHGGRGSERMSLGAMREMFAIGALSPKQAARRGLEAATSKRYRAENPQEFERIVEKHFDRCSTPNAVGR